MNFEPFSVDLCPHRFLKCHLESLFAIAQACFLFFTAPKMSQYSIGIMGFLTGGLPMLINLFLDTRKLTFCSKIQIIFQKWAPAVLFIIGLITIGVNPSILQISDYLAEYFCSVICCIILSMPFIFNFGLRSKTSFLRKLAKVAEGKEEQDGKEMTIMSSYLFISIARIIISLLVYITYCSTQENYSY